MEFYVCCSLTFTCKFIQVRGKRRHSGKEDEGSLLGDTPNTLEDPIPNGEIKTCHQLFWGGFT